MSNKKFAALMATMPSLRHSIPDKEFNIRDSQVVHWLLEHDDVLQWLFNKARDTERIKFDPETKMWTGVGLPDEIEGDIR